jgi:ATP-dependent protease HslVU (ClpYQ) peptidase subunit
MTCIIGLVEDGNVYMGGDAAGVVGLSITTRADEKVFVNGPFLMGFTTSFRMGQILRYKFVPPAHNNKVNDMKYMVSDFVDSLRKCFHDNGFGDADSSTGGTFLVGYKGKLYKVDSDYQVGIPTLKYDACGCGADIALGAMFASKGEDPEVRIKTALKAAATFSAGVRAPFKLLSLMKK